MKSWRKSSVLLILAGLVCVATGPFRVWAEDMPTDAGASSETVQTEGQEEGSQDNSSNSAVETVTLTEDTVRDIYVAAGEEMILDLGEFTLTGTGAANTATITNDGVLTIRGNGKVIGENNGYYIVANHGKMTIDGGEYLTNSTVTTKAGPSGIENGYYSSDDSITEYAELTINGGTFTGGLNAVKNDEWGKLTVNGGAFSGRLRALYNAGDYLTINGGEFRLAVEFTNFDNVKNVVVNGGYYNSPWVTAKRVNDHYATMEIGGDVSFKATAAQTLGNFYHVTSLHDMTIPFQNWTMVFEDGATVKNVVGNGLVITGGNVEISDYTVNSKMGITVKGKSANGDNATVTFKSGTFHLATASEEGAIIIEDGSFGGTVRASGADATLEIRGGNFAVTPTENDGKYNLAGTVELMGGEYVSEPVAAQVAEGYKAYKTAEGYAVMPEIKMPEVIDEVTENETEENVATIEADVKEVISSIAEDVSVVQDNAVIESNSGAKLLIKNARELLAAFKSGAEVKAKLVGGEEDVSSTLEDDELLALEEKLADNAAKLGVFNFDVALFAGDEEVAKLTELSDAVTIEYDISAVPAVKAGYSRAWQVVRYHNNEAIDVPVSLSEDGKSLVFTSKEFSSFMIALIDTMDPVPEPTDEGTTTEGGEMESDATTGADTSASGGATATGVAATPETGVFSSEDISTGARISRVINAMAWGTLVVLSVVTFRRVQLAYWHKQRRSNLDK